MRDRCKKEFTGRVAWPGQAGSSGCLDPGVPKDTSWGLERSEDVLQGSYTGKAEVGGVASGGVAGGWVPHPGLPSDLMIEMEDQTNDVHEAGIPVLDYKTYTDRVFFLPSKDGDKDVMITGRLDIPESRRPVVEQALYQFSNLLNSKSFLVTVSGAGPRGGLGRAKRRPG